MISGDNGPGLAATGSWSTTVFMFVRRMVLAWENAYWSPTLDWFWPDSERWYWALVISPDDRPASSVAMTVMRTGVVVMMVSKKPFFALGSSGGGLAGLVAMSLLLG